MSAPRPPKAFRLLTRLLLRGEHGRFVRSDLEESFARDFEKGIPLGKARRRYARNLAGSAWSLARARAACLGRGVSLLDVTLALRMLRRNPALTAVAVFALSMGIPIGLIPFHLGQVVSPALPFDQGERIVQIQTTDVEASRGMTRVSGDFRTWREELTSFQTLGASSLQLTNLASEDGRAAPVRGVAMTASAFDIVRVAPAMGRLLGEADERPGAPDVVVMGHDLWRSRFAGDGDIVGRTILLGGIPHEVVGVMPEGFLFPRHESFWVPLRLGDLPPANDEGPSLKVFGRLADGVSMVEADEEVSAYSRRMATVSPETHRHLRAEVLEFTGRGIRGTLPYWVLQLLALSLLAVACGNVGMLVLARTSTRTGEIAIRTALGASRARIVGQIFVEALVLAVLGAGFGLLIGAWATARLEAALAPGGLPFWFDLGLTRTTVVTALVLATASAAMAGVPPALRATGRGVQQRMQRASAGGSGIRFGRLSTSLIVTEVALATAFLALVGQVLPSVVQGHDAGMGIAPSEYLSAWLDIPAEPLATLAGTPDTTAARVRAHRVQEDLLRGLAADPAVRGVALSDRLPGEAHPTRAIEVRNGGTHDVFAARVAVDYFRALGQTPRSGRDFRPADVAPSLPTEARNSIVVNTSFVEHVLGGRNALGQQVRTVGGEGEESGPWLEIVGVVGHLGMNEINPDRDAGFYRPVALGELNPARLAIHLRADPLSFVPDLRRLAAAVDARTMVRDPMPLDAAVRLSESRLAVFWFGLLATMIASVAVVLSAACLYALVSFTVSERRREIGIRTALGARRSDLLRAIVRRALMQMSLGITLGVLLGRGLTSFLDLDVTSALRAISPWAVLAASAGATLIVGLLACVPPLLRGMRIRPVDVLKEI